MDTLTGQAADAVRNSDVAGFCRSAFRQLHNCDRLREDARGHNDMQVGNMLIDRSVANAAC
jgi:hypothetical protein